MSDNTLIEWADHTFNPWWGCQKVSPACDHCYAELDAKRFAPGRVLWGVGSERRTVDEKHWQAPLRWAKNEPARLGRRPRVLCASMADWLDLDAPISGFARLLDLIRLTPDLDWLLLSKRIGNWRKRLEQAAMRGDATLPPLYHWWVREWLDGNPPANIWLGATVVNQEEADRDIPKLLAVPARVRFLSIAPMLGPISLDCWPVYGEDERPLLHWVICGGESGPKARPMHPEWARGLRDQCSAAGVPFLFTQWGEWAPAESVADDDERKLPERWLRLDGTEPAPGSGVDFFGGDEVLYRLGKKAAGRLLDGRTHDGFPGQEGGAA